MNFRFEHLIVAFTVTIIMMIFIYLLDYAFTSSYQERSYRYESDFNKIELELNNKNFENVISLSNLIIDKKESGTNDIRAKSYHSIAKINIGQSREATTALIELMNHYPGIKYVYSESLSLDKSDITLLFIYNNILTDYIKSYNEAIESEITLIKLLNAMDYKRWVMFISVLVSSLVCYEHIRNKTVNEKKNAQQ